MNQEIIEGKLLKAIQVLFKDDIFLIAHNLSELSITHKLANYLEQEFEEFDVDCEYNGNGEDDNTRKYIHLLRREAERLGRISATDEPNSTTIKRAVRPDIIVHSRGNTTPGSNLLIVEVKKSSNPTRHDYDKAKLSIYTSTDENNYLAYMFGAFVLINIDQQNCDIDWFAKGCSIDKPAREAGGAGGVTL